MRALAWLWLVVAVLPAGERNVYPQVVIEKPSLVAPAKLDEDQLFALYVKHGFPPHIAVTLGAVAKRESQGDPRAFNDNPDTKDLSYGLLQINLFGSLGVARRAQFRAELGFEKDEDLFDPDMNARAAFLIWGGDNRNLETAWALKLVAGGYKDRYEVHLPAMQTAALASLLNFRTVPPTIPAIRIPGLS